MYLYKKVPWVISSVTLLLGGKSFLFWFISPTFNSWTLWGNVPFRSISTWKWMPSFFALTVFLKTWASWGTTHSRRLILDPKKWSCLLK